MQRPTSLVKPHATATTTATATASAWDDPSHCEVTALQFWVKSLAHRPEKHTLLHYLPCTTLPYTTLHLLDFTASKEVPPSLRVSLGLLSLPLPLHPSSRTSQTVVCRPALMDFYTLPNVTEPPQPTASSLSIPSILCTTTLTVSLLSLVYWCVQDYRLYMSLGPGGPPYNVWGWMSTAFIVRPFTLAPDDTTWTGDYPDVGCHKEIEALPERVGGRPVVLGIAPQRQFTQRPSPEMNKVSPWHTGLWTCRSPR